MSLGIGPNTRWRTHMRTEPVPYDGSRPAEPIRKSSGVARRIGARLLHEVRDALPPTIFFLSASILSY